MAWLWFSSIHSSLGYTAGISGRLITFTLTLIRPYSLICTTTSPIMPSSLSDATVQNNKLRKTTVGSASINTNKLFRRCKERGRTP
ncbi:uncharacterized protein BO95DRAFT_66725 [Aspergillus brunneoviolaceus CBS 621.78]|uniref:Uncharacterized protein n=1 Tax=Aspergillus brunneoviolaceus CBS 621.78 TaxID=1450534 RepID=A0ACD1GFL1_9EURO|nr:hypothetical protein BO95DRAFT_66725 [Aspergillus brunneoviolaceus CBS 621.78]RAH48053.1 hypothetical protein BO95DRAFT_66725 [Aspergillus brunneoviolaceus CBS 621.78]